MKLATYRKKRDLRRSGEPAGQLTSERGARRLTFVVQKHWAAKVHYDLRLEHDGVLKSWAVPKDIPLANGAKRLAIMVEDHPLEYGRFEGAIPPGNYGAGEVLLWDRGGYHVKGSRSPEESERMMAEGLRRGALHLVFHGEEMRGDYTLVRFRKAGKNEWLFIRQARQSRDDGYDARSGERLVEAEGGMGQATDRPVSLASIPGAVPAGLPHAVEPMLATLVDKAFDRPGWIFEVKWDGYRTIAEIAGGKVRLSSRNGKDFTGRFPSVARELKRLRGSFVLDGEIVALGPEGMPQFQLLQNYRRAPRGSIAYFVFDIVYADGYNLMRVPLLDRRRVLRAMLPASPVVRLSDHIAEAGLSYFRAAAENGIEGIMAKDGASPYRPGVRGDEWLKIKTTHRQEAVIGGFTRPKGSREHFGSLILGTSRPDGMLDYIGHAGTGFDDRSLAYLDRRFAPLVAGSSPFAGPVDDAPGDVIWLRPELVCEVKFAGWTKEGRMRQAVFRGLRDDKAADAVKKETAAGTSEVLASEEPARVERTIEGNRVVLTNLAKVFWPGEGYTKRDLIEYYDSIAPFLLPHLHDRPLILRRQPDGIRGTDFVQHDVNLRTPAGVETVRVPTETGGDLRSVVCQNRSTLLYLANLGCIEMHPWNSRRGSLDRPDYLVFDFDPVGTSFASVLDAVRATHEVLAEAGAGHFFKTSGGRGMHVYVPLNARYSYGQARRFAEAVGLIVHERTASFTSLERRLSRRAGKVYIDTGQNSRAKSVAAPYSVRSRAGAPVSCPVRWEEIEKGLDPEAFTIRTVGERLQRAGDLWRRMGETGIDMEQCVERLQDRFGTNRSPVGAPR